jgi:hypothetical protein
MEETVSVSENSYQPTLTKRLNFYVACSYWFIFSSLKKHNYTYSGNAADISHVTRPLFRPKHLPMYEVDVIQ